MYYVDLDLVEKAKEVLEATLKTSSTYLDEDNKYVSWVFNLTLLFFEINWYIQFIFYINKF